LGDRPFRAKGTADGVRDTGTPGGNTGGDENRQPGNHGSHPPEKACGEHAMAAERAHRGVPLDVLTTASALPERAPVVSLQRILDEDPMALRAGGGDVQHMLAAVRAADHDHDTRI
jgi:hypothetical protein